MKNNIKLLFLFALSLVVISCNEQIEGEKREATKDKTFTQFSGILDRYVEGALENNSVSSYALAVYKDGKTHKNYYETNTHKLTDSSLYEIASITKTFTGSLVAKAVLEGKISLDNDIREYLEGNYSNLEFEGHPITIKNLLTHSLGLEQKTPPKLEAFNEKVNLGLNIEDLDLYRIGDLLEELKSARVNKKPGTVYAYNSVGPELLAYVLEQVNKRPFQEQVKDFFDELGMKNTYLQESHNYRDRLVAGYKGDKEALIEYCAVYGAAGGAITTLPDLVLYMQYLIDNKEEPWVKEASRTLFTDPEDGEEIGYLWQNIGFAVEEGYYYSKTGTSKGIQSGLLLCPDSDYGIILIANNTSDKAYDNWARLLFYDVEPDIIKYPKLNLFSVLEKDFINNQEEAFKKFRSLKNDTVNYYLRNYGLNKYGYKLLRKNKIEKAISIFTFATQEFPENANTFDSLAEAYFLQKDYKNALVNYRKSLVLNPNNENAKIQIDKIEKLIA